MLLITVALVVLGAVLLGVGLLSSSTLAFFGAAAASAAAVVLLWRVVGRTRDRVFVTNPASASAPQWDSPISRSDDHVEDQGQARDQLPGVAIAQYEDLVASEIMPSLETLSIDQLQAVIAREKVGLARPIIIARAETLIDLTRGIDPSLDLREGPVAPTRGRSRRGPSRDDGLSLE